MVPNIICRGFSISAQQVKALGKKIGQYMELCPSDSSMDLEINKVGDHFEMVAHVYHLGGAFTSVCSALTLDDVIKNNMDKLYKQMRHWREHRFDTDENKKNLTPNDGKQTDTAPRILIVDDELGSTKILQTCLEKVGCNATYVSSGTAAIEEILSKPYDLVFLDWIMPDMNGGEALMKIQLINSSTNNVNTEQKPVPIITYSSHVRNDLEMPDCKDFEFIDHWTKSTPLTELLAKTKDAISKVSGGKSN